MGGIDWIPNLQSTAEQQRHVIKTREKKKKIVQVFFGSVVTENGIVKNKALLSRRCNNFWALSVKDLGSGRFGCHDWIADAITLPRDRVLFDPLSRGGRRKRARKKRDLATGHLWRRIKAIEPKWIGRKLSRIVSGFLSSWTLADLLASPTFVLTQPSIPFGSFSSCYGLCRVVLLTHKTFWSDPGPPSLCVDDVFFSNMLTISTTTKGCIFERLLLVLFNKSGRWRSTSLRQKKRHQHRLKEINTLTHKEMKVKEIKLAFFSK